MTSEQQDPKQDDAEEQKEAPPQETPATEADSQEVKEEPAQASDAAGKEGEEEQKEQPRRPVEVYGVLRFCVAQLAAVAWQKMGLQADPLTNEVHKDVEQARVAGAVEAETGGAGTARLRESAHGPEVELPESVEVTAAGRGLSARPPFGQRQLPIQSWSRNCMRPMNRERRAITVLPNMAPKAIIRNQRPASEARPRRRPKPRSWGTEKKK